MNPGNDRGADDPATHDPATTRRRSEGLWSNRCANKLDRVDDREVLLPAPLNAVTAPPGKDPKHGRGGAGMLVLARLVWRNRVSIVPAVAVWISDDTVCVEWRSHARSRPRMTWLAREDVRPRLLYPRAGSDLRSARETRPPLEDPPLPT